MSELFKEIEDDIRRERFDRLWHSFGKLMVGVSIVVVVLTIGVVVVQNRRQSAAMEKTAQFIKGMDRLAAQDFKGAVTIFTALSDDDSSPYYGLAMLRKAAAETALGDKEAAAKTYHALAGHPTEMGQLALMMGTQGESLPEPQKTSPFYYTHSEWKGWQLLQQGKKDEAVAQLASVQKNLAAPHSMRERLTEALEHISPETPTVKAMETLKDDKTEPQALETKSIDHDD